MPTVLIHIANEDPIMGEIDQLPGLTDTSMQMVRIGFIEIIPGEEEEQIIGFVRE
jgi:hypothetical protein